MHDVICLPAGLRSAEGPAGGAVAHGMYVSGSDLLQGHPAAESSGGGTRQEAQESRDPRHRRRRQRRQHDQGWVEPGAGSG